VTWIFGPLENLTIAMLMKSLKFGAGRLDALAGSKKASGITTTAGSAGRSFGTTFDAELTELFPMRSPADDRLRRPRRIDGGRKNKMKIIKISLDINRARLVFYI
jgi:hypothetical protein